MSKARRNDQGDRTVRVSGRGNAGIAGDNNDVSVRYREGAKTSSAGLHLALDAIGNVLQSLRSSDSKKIANAVEDAHTEVEKPQPDKDEVGKCLQRALEYAKKASEFAAIADKLAPHIRTVVAWLGSSWNHLLASIGSSLHGQQ